MGGAEALLPHANLTGTGSKRLPFSSHQEPVAQLVEHRTFNAVVAGSSPARLTIIFNKLDRIVRLLLA